MNHHYQISTQGELLQQVQMKRAIWLTIIVMLLALCVLSFLKFWDKANGIRSMDEESAV